MKTYIFEVETVVVEQMYIEAETEDEAKENVLQLGEVDENTKSSNVIRVVLAGIED